jgi:general stress protein 26
MTITPDIKNLYGAEALKKVQDLVEAENVCLFASNLSEKPITVRPMSTLKVDELGNMWFFSAKNSQKNKNIQADPAVQLLYSNHSCSEYLSIYGKAQVITDKEMIKIFWTSFAKAWFHGGVEDPAISLIMVTPEKAYYWDTKHGKIVSAMKILASSITGMTADESTEGELRIA